MGILTKYIADGTVLDMIWKWLKAGYMKEGKYHEVDAGTPQGGAQINVVHIGLFLSANFNGFASVTLILFPIIVAS